MNIFSRIINTLVWMWRLTELAAKVAKAEQDLVDLDGRIDARMDAFWKEFDARQDRETAAASADRAALREEMAELRGTMREINRQRHGSA